MISIELRDEKGKVKRHSQPFVSARKLRMVMEFGTSMEKSTLSELEQLDKMVELVASLFDGDQVTFDTIYDGLAANELADTLTNVLEEVMGGMMSEGEVKAGK